MKDIFDLINIDDLPNNLKEEINKCNKIVSSHNIIQLFKIKKVLYLDEIRVAYYRKFKIEVERKRLQLAISSLIQSVKLRKIGFKKYELVDTNLINDYE